jgi:hypothetical protein
MADTGALSPQTMADDATVGTMAWLGPSNSKTSNNSYSFVDFFYDVPNPGDPAPIVVEVEKKYNPDTTGYVADNAIRIVKGGTVGSTDKSSVSEWPLTDTYISYGASDNLWGETWTAEDINLSTFGFALSCYATNSNAYSYSPTASVDHIRITVYYTESTFVSPLPTFKRI